MFLVLGLVIFAVQLPRLALPEGNSTWRVQVVTSGGLLGNGGGDFAISSEGRMVCTREIRCPSDFKPAEFQPLVEVIEKITLPSPTVPVVSLCRDCITRTMTVSFRDSIGRLHIYMASWDDTTKAMLPPEIVRIYDAVRELTK